MIALQPKSIRVPPASAEDRTGCARQTKTVIYRGINTQYILGMPYGEPLMTMRQVDEGGWPVDGRGWCIGHRTRLVSDDA